MHILLEHLGNRKAVLARELTKKFETFERNRLEDLLKEVEDRSPRGEYVILLEGRDENFTDKEESTVNWNEEALKLAETMPLKEAARQIAFSHHLSRRDVYQYLLREKEED